MQGVPYTFDLLVTDDLGRSWEDVFQAEGSGMVKRPRAPGPPGGPVEANQGFSGSLPQSALSPAPGTLWLTSYDENSGGEALASTGDGGQQWAQSYVPGELARPRQVLPPYGWLSTAASSALDGWALFSGPVPKHGPQASTLYVTRDSGAAWARTTTFSWP
jgi:hypothetical protein